MNNVCYIEDDHLIAETVQTSSESAVIHLNEFLNYIDEFGIDIDSVVSFNLSLTMMCVCIDYCLFLCLIVLDLSFVNYDESV